MKYRKILIKSPGLLFVQKAVLVASFSGKLTFVGAYMYYIGENFAFQNGLGLHGYKTSLKGLHYVMLFLYILKS